LGQLLLGLFRSKSQYLGLTDMPNDFKLRFPFFVIFTIKGTSPLLKILLFPQGDDQGEGDMQNSFGGGGED
jgi:hypothetical protein